MTALCSSWSRHYLIFFESCPYCCQRAICFATRSLLHALKQSSEARCIHEIKSLDIYPTRFSYFTPPRARHAGYQIFRARGAGGRSRIRRNARPERGEYVRDRTFVYNFPEVLKDNNNTKYCSSTQIDVLSLVTIFTLQKMYRNGRNEIIGLIDASPRVECTYFWKNATTKQAETTVETLKRCAWNEVVFE